MRKWENSLPRREQESLLVIHIRTYINCSIYWLSYKYYYELLIILQRSFMSSVFPCTDRTRKHFELFDIGYEPCMSVVSLVL